MTLLLLSPELRSQGVHVLSGIAGELVCGPVGREMWRRVLPVPPETRAVALPLALAADRERVASPRPESAWLRSRHKFVNAVIRT